MQNITFFHKYTYLFLQNLFMSEFHTEVLLIKWKSMHYKDPLFPKEIETSNNKHIYKTHVLKQGLFIRYN